MRSVFWHTVNKCVFSADLKVLELSIGSQRWSGSEFQTTKPATENAQKLNLQQ